MERKLVAEEPVVDALPFHVQRIVDMHTHVETHQNQPEIKPETEPPVEGGTL